MTADIDETSIRTEVVVDAAQDRAFKLFTEQFDKIKPREHNMLGVEIAESVFEPRVGGRVYDRGIDGSECQWARVLSYEPPERIVFTWDISPYWQIETDLGRASEVEIRFIAESEERTRVTLEHRHLDRHGHGWEGLRGDDRELLLGHAVLLGRTEVAEEAHTTAVDLAHPNVDEVERAQGHPGLRDGGAQRLERRHGRRHDHRGMAHPRTVATDHSTPA